MPQGTREKARIALLIVVAVLAITLAMLEALAHTRPAPVPAARSFPAPSALDPALAPAEIPTDGSAHPGTSARNFSE